MSGERCPSVHYWSQMQCQRKAGHAEPHAADVSEGSPLIIAGKRMCHQWLDGPKGAMDFACNQREVERGTPTP